VPEIPIAQAVERLVKAVEEQLPADEVQDIYNAVFRRRGMLVEQTDASPEATRRRIEQLVAHLRGDRYPEEIVALWGLVFTHRDIWYNEEEDSLHYCDDPAAYLTEWESGTD
jgi:hypothetical protein